MPSFAHTPLHLRTWKTEIEPVRQRRLSTRAVPICCAKARACFRRTLTRCIVLLTERTCSSVPSWPNNQKIASSSPAGMVHNRLDSCCSQNHGRRNGGSPQAGRGGANTIAKSKVKASPPTSLHASVRTSLVRQKSFCFCSPKTKKSRCAAARPTLKNFFFFVCVCASSTPYLCCFLFCRGRDTRVAPTKLTYNEISTVQQQCGHVQ